MSRGLSRLMSKDKAYAQRNWMKLNSVLKSLYSLRYNYAAEKEKQSKIVEAIEIISALEEEARKQLE